MAGLRGGASFPRAAGRASSGSTSAAPRACPRRRFYWPETGRLEAVGTFPGAGPRSIVARLTAWRGRYVEMEDAGRADRPGRPDRARGAVARRSDAARRRARPSLRSWPTATSRPSWARRCTGPGIRAPVVWRGQGFRDGGEDVERFRRAAFDGQVKFRAVAPAALCLRGCGLPPRPGEQHQAGQGPQQRAGSTRRRRPSWPWPRARGMRARPSPGSEAGMGMRKLPAHQAGHADRAVDGAARMRSWSVTAGPVQRCGKRGRLEVDHVKPVRTAPRTGIRPGQSADACACPVTPENPLRNAAIRPTPSAPGWRNALPSWPPKPIEQRKINMLDSVKIARRQSEIRQALVEPGRQGHPDRGRNPPACETSTGIPQQRNPLSGGADRRGHRTARGRGRAGNPRGQGMGRPGGGLRDAPGRAGPGRGPQPLDGRTAEVVQELRSAGGYRGTPDPLGGAGTRRRNRCQRHPEPDADPPDH